MDEQRPAAGMTCPVCDVDLVMTERQNVEIDYCPKCRGVWLDRGELDKIVERGASETPEPRTHVPGGFEPRGHAYPGEKKHKSWLSELFD